MRMNSWGVVYNNIQDMIHHRLSVWVIPRFAFEWHTVKS